MNRNGFLIIILFLTFVIEGCTIYQNQPSTIKEASKANKKVKVIDLNNEVTYYKQLFLDGEEIKAIKNFGEKDSVVTIPRNNIKEIHIKDSAATTIVIVLSSVAAAFGLIGLIFLISGGIGPLISL
jgi:hypothetical protein